MSSVETVQITVVVNRTKGISAEMNILQSATLLIRKVLKSTETMIQSMLAVEVEV